MSPSSLRLSQKFFENRNYFEDKEYTLIFDEGKSKLTFKKTADINGRITELSTIISFVNGLNNPEFNGIESFRNLHRTLKAINQYVKALNQCGEHSIAKIELAGFVKNFKPSAGDLKEKVYAVHATDYLHPEGVLVPYARLNPLACVDSVPLSLSNNLHFALGEVVRPHHSISWDSNPFAVITPLGTLMGSIVNINAADTFIKGRWEIPSSAVLLVPLGTDVARYKDSPFEIVFYDAETSTLRQAVQNEIKRRGGLTFKMQDYTSHTSTKARLDGINVNTIDFFYHLLSQHPEISFGTHPESLKGDAYILGIIKQATDILSQLVASQSEGEELSIESNTNIVLWHALLTYYFEKVKDKYFAAEEVVQMNTLLADAKNLMDAEQEVTAPSSNPLRNMDWEELHSYMKKSPEVFENYHAHEFEALWAIQRWILIGQTRAEEEGLPQKVQEEMSLFLSTSPTLFIIDLVLNVLPLISKANTHSKEMLTIFNMGVVREYISRLGEFGVQFLHEGYSTESVESFLKSILPLQAFIHAEHDPILDFQEEVVSQGLGKAFEILLAFRPIALPSKDVWKKDFDAACDILVFLMQGPLALKTLQEKPIRDQFNEGSEDLAYLYKKLYCNGLKLWRKLGLGQAFIRLFPNDDDFWNTDLTFVQVFQKLKEGATS